MKKVKPTNEEIAQELEQIARFLEMQDANIHRIRAYRTAAANIAKHDEPLAKYVRKGQKEKLEELPGIGKSLTRIITEYVKSGKIQLKQRLQGETSPEKLFVQVPEIGEKLAERISDKLGIHSLEELEEAAYNGRLKEVEGFGQKRVEAVKVSLSGMLSSFARRRRKSRETGEKAQISEPTVDILLDVEREYRQKAEKGELKRIAPRRFNPAGKAWLPILHTEREEWEFTALYSNTAKAHELGKTDDWVVIYYEKDGEEDQCTVVTAGRGSLKGKRVIRGREEECEKYYKKE
ncbi:MAG: DNA-binding protein [Calditrichaeota bacterium]|nr:DNA-binding protein [Calditrichota bacterium]